MYRRKTKWNLNYTVVCKFILSEVHRNVPSDCLSRFEQSFLIVVVFPTLPPLSFLILFYLLLVLLLNIKNAKREKAKCGFCVEVNKMCSLITVCVVYTYDVFSVSFGYRMASPRMFSLLLSFYLHILRLWSFSSFLVKLPSFFVAAGCLFLNKFY